MDNCDHFTVGWIIFFIFSKKKLIPILKVARGLGVVFGGLC